MDHITPKSAPGAPLSGFWEQKKVWFWMTGILTGIFAVIFLCTLLGKPRIAFRDISCSSEGITAFMQAVCTHIPGEKVTLLETLSESDRYTGSVVIKPHGKVPVKSDLHFYPAPGSDALSHISADFSSFDADTDTKFSCQLELISALETALCGRSQIRDLLPDRTAFLTRVASSGVQEEQVYATYQLTDDLMAVITTRVVGSEGGMLYWYIHYEILF